MPKFEIDIPTTHVKRIADAGRAVLNKPTLTDAQAVKQLVAHALRQMVGHVEVAKATTKAEADARKSAEELPIA